MKNWLIILAVGIVSMSMSFAGGEPKLQQEIQSKVHIDLSDIELNQYDEDYVLVKFQIINEEIFIEEIDGTSGELKERIVQELYKIHVDAEYEAGESYVYKFTFEKI